MDGKMVKVGFGEDIRLSVWIRVMDGVRGRVVDEVGCRGWVRVVDGV